MAVETTATGGSEAARNQFALFRTRRFWPLFTVQFFGAFNDQTFKNAFVALLTYRLADRLALSEGEVDAYVQIAAGLYILPFALCAATAGQIADGMDKARMMRWVKFAEIVLMGIAAAAYLTQSLPILFGLMFLMGAQSAFFAPIKYGVLPQYMRRDEMPAANGLIQGATFLAILLGQIFGAKLVLTEGGVAGVSAAVVLIAVIGWIASFAAPPAPPQGPRPKVNWVMPVAMVRIIAQCWGEKPAMFAMLALGWFWFAGATFLSLIFQIAKFSLLASENVALILLTSFSVGIAVGAVIYSVIVKGRVTLKTAPWGAAGIGVGALGFCFAVRAYGGDLADRAELLTVGEFLARWDAWPVLGALIFMAMFAGLYVTPLNVEYQVKAPEGRKGRFVACSNVIDSLSMVASAGAAAVLIGLVGVPREIVFALAGATGFIAAYVVWRRARREE
ncbi:MFS transporter [Pikeienuella sp. HZG-20]|uniref:MFS transporter n=1 Tax=Paludibacillus litoralis TaxID=3133267 RepID=UPI0030EBFA29